jgi:hypothetical protein
MRILSSPGTKEKVNEKRTNRLHIMQNSRLQLEKRKEKNADRLKREIRNKLHKNNRLSIKNVEMTSEFSQINLNFTTHSEVKEKEESEYDGFHYMKFDPSRQNSKSMFEKRPVTTDT